jgi:predicted Zn finger-like uncharacterized protein
MLVTTCKYCGARFRVTPDQLNLRQGQVRCGQCREVFNGFEALERFPGDDTGAKLLALRAGPAHPSAAGAARDEGDIGRRVAPAGPAPPPAPAAPTGLPDVPDLLLDDEPAAATHVDLPVQAPEPSRLREPAAAEPGAPREAPAVVLAASLEPPPTFGVVFLTLVLVLQLAYAFRSRLAQQYPDLRPPLEAVCAAVGCRVPYLNDEAALKLDDSELLEVPGKPGQISLQARVRNLSSSPQEYPHLELTLTDLTGQTAVRRVLRPADYLGRALAQGEVMPPGAEILVSVRLEVANVRPTGYELLVFYP